MFSMPGAYAGSAKRNPLQRSLFYFINPYPIFERHFTVPSRHHEPQCIGGRFEDLLDLTFDFQGYTLFYNGPTCGASAPDHFHFQMCPRHLMPLEEDAANEELRRYLVKKTTIRFLY